MISMEEPSMEESIENLLTWARIRAIVLAQAQGKVIQLPGMVVLPDRILIKRVGPLALGKANDEKA